MRKSKIGFIQNEDESCVYKKTSGSSVTFLPSLRGVKASLEKCFSMKDLGEATYIHGIKIYRD